MKKGLFVIMIAVIIEVALVACENNTSHSFVPAPVPDTNLTAIDMSLEKDNKFYTYFRFVNETGVPILIEYVEKGYDVASMQYIAPYNDAIDKFVSDAEFVTFRDSYGLIHIYYNFTEESSNDDYIKVECIEGDLLDDALWSTEEIDANSIIRTFVVTKQMYEDIK